MIRPSNPPMARILEPKVTEAKSRRGLSILVIVVQVLDVEEFTAVKTCPTRDSWPSLQNLCWTHVKKNLPISLPILDLWPCLQLMGWRIRLPAPCIDCRPSSPDSPSCHLGLHFLNLSTSGKSLSGKNKQKWFTSAEFPSKFCMERILSGVFSRFFFVQN